MVIYCLFQLFTLRLRPQISNEKGLSKIKKGMIKKKAYFKELKVGGASKELAPSS